MSSVAPASNNNEENVNPFKHRLHLNWCQNMQIALMSVTIAPIRMLLIVICKKSFVQNKTHALLALLWANLLSRIGMLGLSGEELEAQPLESWRKVLQKVVRYHIRAVFFFMGIHWVKTKGQLVRTGHSFSCHICHL